MKKMICCLTLCGMALISFGQQNANLTVKDALYFLNKKYRNDEGQIQINCTDPNSNGGKPTIPLPKYRIDTLFITPDSVLVINTSSHVIGNPETPAESHDHYKTQYRL